MIEEPAEGTIVCWFDPNDDLFAVYQRISTHLEDHEDPNDPHRWSKADGGDGGDGPLTWPVLLVEMGSWRGPIELISNGRLS